MAGLFFALVFSFLGFLTPNAQVSAADTISLKVEFKQTGAVNAAVMDYFATVLFNSNPISCANNSCNTNRFEIHWNFDDKAQVTRYDNKNPIQFAASDGSVVKVIVKDLQANTSYQAQGKISEAKAVTTPPAIEGTGKTVADTILDPLFGIVNKILQTLAFGIVGLLYFLLNSIIIPIIQVLLTIQPHDASFSAVILVGWVFVRNVANILFIIAMIILGMATLLRVEKYNYKHLIPELVLMAIAVNFSLVVAQLILGVADTFQTQFLPNNKDVLNALAHQLMVSPLQNISKGVFHGSFADLIATLVYFIFAVGTFFVFAAIAAFLVIRIVALWLLLMLSPIAYVGMILPDTHHEAMKWWSNFLKYAFQTPILGFFLHLCAVIAVSQSKFLAKATENTSLTTGGVNTAAQFAYNSLSSILLLVCLMAGLEVAKELGTFGAGAITGAVEKATHFVGVKPIEMGLESAYSRAQKYKRRATANWSSPLTNARGETFYDRDPITGERKGGLNFARGVKGLAKKIGFSALNADIVAEKYWEAQHHHEEKAKDVIKGAAQEQQHYWETGEINEGMKTAIEKQEQEYLSQYLTKSPAENAKILRRLMAKMATKPNHETQEQINSLLQATYMNNKQRKLYDEYNSVALGGDGSKFSTQGNYRFLSQVLNGEHDQTRLQDTLNDIAKKNKNPLGIGLQLVDLKEFQAADSAFDSEVAKLRSQGFSDADIYNNPEVNSEVRRLGKQVKEITAAREERLLAQLENFSTEDLSKISTKGMEFFDKYGERNSDGSPKINRVYEAFIKKMEERNVPLSQSTMEDSMGSLVDKNTGMVGGFKNIEQVQKLKYLIQNHRDLAIRYYNRARNVNPGHRDYKDYLPPEVENLVKPGEEKRVIFRKKGSGGKNVYYRLDQNGQEAGLSEAELANFSLVGTSQKRLEEKLLVDMKAKGIPVSSSGETPPAPPHFPHPEGFETNTRV